MIAILMGVTGSGKTTVAELLRQMTGRQFAEGDEFHSEAMRQKMHSGIPLTDEDRAPWLGRIHDLRLDWSRAGVSGIVACSALREIYRQQLKEGISSSDLRFVFLCVSRPVLEERLARRKHHFMNPKLLSSQLETLEQPHDAIEVFGEEPPRQIVQDILRQLLREIEPPHNPASN